MKYFQKLFFLFLLAMWSCDFSTSPDNVTQDAPFMSLHVGDIREYYDSLDNSYFKWEILNTTNRTDGLEVFTIEESFETIYGIFTNISYYFIRNGNLFRSNLDTANNPALKNINPFYEQKLAKLYPMEGDHFLITEGVPDSNRLYMHVHFLDSISTPIRTFFDIAEYTQIDSNSTSEQKVFYTKEYGHLGTKIKNNSREGYILLNYLKLDGKEIGTFVPFDSTSNVVDNKASPIIF